MLRNFSYVIENQLAGCAHPDSSGSCDDALLELKMEGIGAIVSLDEIGIPLYMVADQDFHYLHLPVADFGVPTFEQVDEFVQFVRRERELNRNVVVHCGAGYGRTGTMLACYLVAEGATPEQAIERVRTARPGSIETSEQSSFVSEYAQNLDKSASKTKRARKKKSR